MLRVLMRSSDRQIATAREGAKDAKGTLPPSNRTSRLRALRV